MVDDAASPSGRAGLIAASQTSSRLYNKMASDPGRDQPDDPFSPSPTEDQGSEHAAHVHSAEAPNEVYDTAFRQSADASANLLHSGPSIEIVGAELYEVEL